MYLRGNNRVHFFCLHVDGPITGGYITVCTCVSVYGSS